MCGPSRPSTGHRIAIMFPSPSPSSSPSSSRSSTPSSTPEPGALSSALDSYSLSFQDAEQTKAIFRSKDTTTADSFQGWKGIELRIERHGDLTQVSEAAAAQPLHYFQLRPSVSTTALGKMEFSLPERLDLNVSDRGIVGRQVTVVATGEAGEVLQMGNGIVGFD